MNYEKTKNQNGEIVINIPLERLHLFRNHPFKIRDDAEMKKVVESIREFGVLQPAIVRKNNDGKFEILSGHRRHHACQKLALSEELTQEGMFAILSEEKKQDLDRVVLKHDTLKKYFPKSFTPRQMEETIIKLLEQWHRNSDR